MSDQTPLQEPVPHQQAGDNAPTIPLSSSAHAFYPPVSQGPVRHSVWTRLHHFWQGGISHQIAVVCTAVILLLGASVGIAAVVAKSIAKPDGYLWQSSTTVAFIQITADTNGHLSGTIQAVSVTSTEQVTDDNAAFTGVENGSQVSLTTSALGISETTDGTFDGDTLTLHVPDSNGYIATDVFHAASIADYNSAAAALRQRATAHALATQQTQATAQARQAEAQATAQMQEAEAQATATTQAGLDQAVVSANQQLSGGLTTMASDVKTLSTSTDFSGPLSGYASDWTQMQSDYQHEQSDYKNGCGTGGYNAGVVSYDAGVVQYDLGTVQYTDGTLTYVVTGVDSATKQVQQDIQTVQADWQNLEAATAADRSGSAIAQFTSSDVNTAVTNAQNQLTASSKALSDAQDQASTYDKEAAQMNTNAQNLANSMKC